MSSFEKFCGGEFWNTSLTWGLDRSWPKFTSCFLNTALVWVPCGWLWVTLPIYSYYLRTRQRKRIRISWLNISKTLFALLLTLLSLVELVEAVGWEDIHGSIPTVLFVSSSVKIVTFLLSVCLLQAERLSGFITSAIQFIFYFLFLVSGVVPFYSYILEEKSSITRASIFFIQYGLIAGQFLLHCFADRLPVDHWRNSQKPISPELEASFLSQITYWWMNSLIYSGYKKSLEETDLWELNPREKGANFIPQFEKSWKTELRRLQQKKPFQEEVKSAPTERSPLLDVNESGYGEEVMFKGVNQDKPRASLVKIIGKHFGGTLLISFFLKLCCDLVQFLSPAFLSLLIAFTQDVKQPVWKGYIYTAGLGATALAQSLFFQMSFFVCMTMGMRVKATLISIVYKKALTMNSESKKSSTVGEVVNLMSVDAQRVGDIISFLYMLWSSPLIIGVSLYLLYGILGHSVFAGLAVMILMIPIVMLISVKTRKLQMAQMKYKDSRIKLMTEILNGIKVLKLYAWELSFQEKITEIRKKELEVLKKAAYLGSANTFIWNCAPILVTIATFTTYILISTENQLTASKAFVALSLFNIIRFPINMMPMIVSFLVQSHVSISRLSKYLHYDDLDLDCVQHNPNYEDAITVENGSFTWDSVVNPTLNNINLYVPDGELLAVVGQVGAGKSSLISAVLGEMNKVRGKVNLRGSVAYVAQQAWIQNATLQDNVLFASEKQDDKYREIIKACALGPDLEMLPGGDLTEIGEKGINLSGGQKQRVSLARAVYNNADIYLLDDPLSAVDAHVGKHIFENVIGAKGILKNKTRILVTHGIQWLSMVDRIAVMTNGEITEIGTYEELLSHHGPFADFIHTYLSEELESSDVEEDPELVDIKVRMLEKMESVLSEENDSHSGEELQIKIRQKRESIRRPSSRSSQLSENDQQEDKVKKNLSKDTKSAKSPDVEKLIEEEKSKTGKVKLTVYVSYIRYVGVTVSFFLLLFYLLNQAAGVYSNVWISLWTEDPKLMNTSQSGMPQFKDKTYTYLGVYGALGLAQGIMVLAYALIFASAQVKAAAALHLNMLTNILRSPMSFFDTTPIGRIINRFSRDVETIDNVLPQTISTFLSCFFGVLSVLVIISLSTPLFLAVVIPLAIVYYLVQKIYIPTTRQLQRMVSTTRSPIYTHFSETFTGASTIRAFGVQERFIKDSLQKVDRNLLFFFAGSTAKRWLGFRLELLGNIVIMTAALFAVVYRDKLTGGAVGLSVSYALQVTVVLNWMVRMSSDLETNIVAVERVKEYSETPTEPDWYCPSRRPNHDWPSTGVVEFQDYSTRYRPGLDLVIKGVTYQVKGGEKVGIVGRTGAGKSSLTVALFRLIEAAGGSIVIDGIKISDIGLHDLRSKLTILPQDPVLFSGSLRMNMDPFNLYTDDQIWQALEHSHLKSYVEGLAAGLEHECGEGGQNLSVGQRQLVCLARTLLRKTKILILDEATAAVDMETDDLIQKTISTEFKDCTVLTIAHRLNTIMDYDKVIVLNSGLIQEFGSPGELLQNKQGMFYGMAKDAGIV